MPLNTDFIFGRSVAILLPKSTIATGVADPPVSTLIPASAITAFAIDPTVNAPFLNTVSNQKFAAPVGVNAFTYHSLSCSMSVR